MAVTSGKDKTTTALSRSRKAPVTPAKTDADAETGIAAKTAKTAKTTEAAKPAKVTRSTKTTKAAEDAKTTRRTSSVTARGRAKKAAWQVKMQPELIDQAPDLELWLSVLDEPEPAPVPIVRQQPDTREALPVEVPLETPVASEPDAEPEPQPEPEPESTSTTEITSTEARLNRPLSDTWNLVDGEERPFVEEFSIHPRSWSLNLKLVVALMILTIVGCVLGFTIVLPHF
ncbi:MAG: hypothetical protein LBM94_00990 [Propionibacteriaceae bacterium]|nr:hypothetical protein [Propionibacteriaceae bacterium]